ncbi:unnamed protein product [Parnassius apollo]|uniref:(apollo) hypothetical protein n=1 Tax=Parnassius apollo TaxID=110799 RepID=A0A8S3W7E4_PARAO|nr:unnamed protein product [Parnassius apollo]
MEELKRKPAYFVAIKNIVQCIETQLKSRFGDLGHEQSLSLCTILDPRYKTSMFIDESAAERAKSNLVTKVYNLMTDGTELTPLATAEPQSSREDDEEISVWRKRNSILEKRRVNPNQNLFQTAQREVELSAR